MSNPIKPFNAADLRKLLATASNKFTALNDDGWIPAISEMELKDIILRGDSQLKIQIALSRLTPAESLNLLARDSASDVRQAVAKNPRTPAETLNLLARDSKCRVLEAVAKNPNTPAETLNLLAKDSNASVREAVARHPSTPAETLNLLARDSDSGVREAVAENPSTPAEALNLLARDSDWNVREAVARNPSTPAESLNLLARDSDASVREAVAKNPNTPKSSCFIATAATGSYDHPITATLRGFRDESLEQTVTGRWFVQKYYQISPPFARWIAQRPAARFTIKWVFLYPLVQLIRFFS